MATMTPEQAAKETSKLGKLRPEAEKYVVQYCSSILEKKKQFSQLKNKFDAIDTAYARYKPKKETEPFGKDVYEYGQTGCDVFAADDVVPPVVVADVDTYVAYLTEVFLSGTPMFPVVSSPSKRKWAEQLETLLDDHAQIGGYVRQLLLFIRDGVKYNFSAIEVDWDGIQQFSVLNDIAAPSGKKLDRKTKKFNRITRLNPRNTVWDWSLSPGDVSEKGDYAGYVDQLSQTKLKTFLNKLTNEHEVYNADKAMNSGGTSSTSTTAFYTEDPQISDYVPNKGSNNGAAPDWDAYFEPGKQQRRGPPKGTMYERFTLYARIMPADFGITAPQPNTPQIWKFVIINNQFMVQAKRIISAFDYLPILFGQPLEDGLNYQTQSIAEGAIPFQEAASTLFNIRFAAARRAVSDRALYIPDMIKPSDINSKTPAPKIPVTLSTLSSKGLSDAYMQIPFDMRGTETTIQDASAIVSFSKELHGVNRPQGGQFQKGNKSVQEWNDTMSGSDGRMRLTALCLEHQVFSPLKSMMALNLFQHGEDTIVTSQASGKQLDIKIDQLRKVVMSFKIADGYTPKSKIASTEILGAGLQMIQQSPILQQQLGASIVPIFIHFMSLSGVKGLEQYDPSYVDEDADAMPQGLDANSLQTPPSAAANSLQPPPAAPIEAGNIPPMT